GGRTTMSNARFGKFPRQHRRAAGVIRPPHTRRVDGDQHAIPRWEGVRTVPDPPMGQLSGSLSGAQGALVSRVVPPALDSPTLAEDPVTSSYVEGLRSTIVNLVELDGQYGGRALVALAEHMFRTASTRLRTGRYPAGLKQDLAATVAELGEVSGWLAFDDGQYKNAKMCNIAALHHARAAGDTDMALFVLGNMALQAQETGRLREGLR